MANATIAHVCECRSNTAIFARLMEEHVAEGTCACIEGKTYRARGHSPSVRISKTCPCTLEKAVLKLNALYRDPNTKPSNWNETGYCYPLTLKAHKEIYGEIYSQVDLSASIRELKTVVAEMQASNALLRDRVAALERNQTM